MVNKDDKNNYEKMSLYNSLGIYGPQDVKKMPQYVINILNDLKSYKGDNIKGFVEEKLNEYTDLSKYSDINNIPEEDLFNSENNIESYYEKNINDKNDDVEYYEVAILDDIGISGVYALLISYDTYLLFEHLFKEKYPQLYSSLKEYIFDYEKIPSKYEKENPDAPSIYIKEGFCDFIKENTHHPQYLPKFLRLMTMDYAYKYKDDNDKLPPSNAQLIENDYGRERRKIKYKEKPVFFPPLTYYDKKEETRLR